jgi:8-oxo-dGTP diphosphatase
MDEKIKLRPKVGVGVIIRKSGKILLLKRKESHGSGTWCPPGGHLEWNESLEGCARRESKEESGCNIKNIEFLAITNDFFKKENKHYVTVFMKADYKSGNVAVREKDKASEIGWFKKDALPKPLFLPLSNLSKDRSYPKRVWQNKKIN